VGRIHVCRCSASHGGHWQVFSVADASPTNCMSGCAAIRVPIPDRNTGRLSTERIGITSVVVESYACLTYLNAGPATKPAPCGASAELHKWARSIYKHACGL